MTHSGEDPQPDETVPRRAPDLAARSGPIRLPGRRAAAAVAALAVAAVSAAYLPSLDAPFFPIDDPQYVVANTRLQNVPLTESWRLFVSRTNDWEYLPVRDLSYRLDMAAFGLSPTGYRAHNLLLYGLGCLGVWFLTLSLLRLVRRPAGRDDGQSHYWIAAFATALFAAHPAHVESVAWIAGRKDVLSGLFAVWALWAFAEGLAPRRRARAWLGASYLLFALAVLSKSTVVPVSVVAFLLAVAARRGPKITRRTVGRAAALAAPLLAIAMGSVALQVFGSRTLAAGAGGQAGGPTVPLRILGALGHIAVAPVRLRLIYDVLQPGLAGLMTIAAGLIFLAATAWGTWLAVRKRSLPGLALAAAGILTVPFLQLVPFTTWSLASERFLFLPVLGVCLAAAVLARPDRRPAGAVLIAVAFAACWFVTFSRSREWTSVERMLAGTARLSPGHEIAARRYIVTVLMKKDRFAEAAATASAVRKEGDRNYLLQYVRTIQAVRNGDLVTPRDKVVPLLRATPREELIMRIELAGAILQVGLLDEAEKAYGDLLADYPERPEPRYNLGLTLAKRGRHGEAAEQLRLAIERGLTTAKAWNQLALAYKNSGQIDRAEDAYRQALDADPHHWHAAYNLANMLAGARNDRTGALAMLQQARRRALAAGDSTAPIDELERLLRNPPAPAR